MNPRKRINTTTRKPYKHGDKPAPCDLPHKKGMVFARYMKDVIKLDKLGHSIGLHSHYHHTKKEKLSYQDQLEDYSKNKLFLSEILNKSSNYIQTASHPFGSYNQDTLKVLDNLGIKLAFKDSMLIEKEKKMKRINNSKFEIAREDHINILRRINL